MIHEVRNQILRSIDLLPYSVYMSSILAADSEKERNIRTNYKAHVDIFNIIKNLVQQKKVGKGPRNILEYSLNLSVDRIINPNSFEETIKNSIKYILSRTSFDQIRNDNILDCLFLSDNLISPDSIADIKKALEELRTQLTSESFRKYVASKLGTDINSERITTAIEEVTSAIIDTSRTLDVNDSDINDRISEVLSELTSQKSAGTNSQLDADVKENIYNKQGRHYEVAIERINHLVAAAIKALPTFSKNDVAQIEGDYQDLVRFFQQLITVKSFGENRVRALYNFFDEKFKAKNSGWNSFDTRLSDIEKRIIPNLTQPEKEQRIYSQQINRINGVDLTEAADLTIGVFNDAVKQGRMSFDTGQSLAKIIIACSICSRLANIFTDDKIKNALEVKYGKQSDGNEDKEKYQQIPARGELNFTIGRYFGVDQNNELQRTNISLNELQKFVSNTLSRVWERIPYNILERQLNESVGTYNSVMYNVVETRNGNVLDKNSSDLFDELQAPEDFKDSISMKLAEWWHKNDKDKEDKPITPEEMYRRTLITKRALGLMGKWTLNFGRMALFFINNGGYASYQQCCKFLASLPSEYTKNSIR